MALVYFIDIKTMRGPLRIEYKDAWYHAIDRGRYRKVIFHDKYDYRIFIELLKETSEMGHLGCGTFLDMLITYMSMDSICFLCRGSLGLGCGTFRGMLIIYFSIVLVCFLLQNLSPRVADWLAVG